MAVRSRAAGRGLGRTLDVTLFIVTGTMGAGKSTLAERLVPLLPELVVFDIDWAITSLGMVAGHPIPEHPPAWPGVGDTWLAIAAAIGRSGRSTVLCGPFDPADLDGLPSRRLHDRVRWIVLDCADDVVRDRLSARGWKSADIEEAVIDAADLRANAFPDVRTDELTPDEVAHAVADWVRSVE